MSVRRLQTQDIAPLGTEHGDVVVTKQGPVLPQVFRTEQLWMFEEGMGTMVEGAEPSCWWQCRNGHRSKHYYKGRYPRCVHCGEEILYIYKEGLAGFVSSIYPWVE